MACHAAASNSRRSHRCRQREHRRLSGHRPKPRRADRGGACQRLWSSAEPWHRSVPRQVRHHRRRRRQLRLSRVAQIRGAAAGRLRPGSGLPSSLRWRHRSARSDAATTSLVGQPDVLGDGAAHVLGARARCVLRPPGNYKRLVRSPGSAQLRDGVRDGNDHQVQPAECADRRGADHLAPRRTQGARGLICGRSATAGARCASSSCTARAGCSSTLVSGWRDSA